MADHGQPPEAAVRHLLTVGPDEGAHAVHGTEMYGIGGQKRPGQSDEQANRDAFVRDCLLDFAAGNRDRLWSAVTTEPTSHGVGNPPYDPTARGRGPAHLRGHRTDLTCPKGARSDARGVVT